MKFGSIARVIGALAFALPAWATETWAEDALATSIAVERPYVLKGDTSPVYVLLRLKARDSDDRPEREPLNLGLVLDRSGSMSDGGKMEFLKPAAHAAIARLDRRDILSVVEYDDAVTVMWPSQRANETAALRRLIDALEPRGSTDLTGGMLRGVAEVEAADARFDLDGRTPSRVILLSDGLANVGVTDPREIARLVREARHRGVRISAIGLGRDYDEDLMQAIAENGGGRYYYVEHPSQLQRIFNAELQSAFDTVARDIKIEFDGASAVKNAHFIGFADSGHGGDASLALEDVFGGEERTLMLRLEVDPRDTGGLGLGSLVVSWTDAASKDEDRSAHDVSLIVTDDADMAARSTNGEVSVAAHLAEAERAQAEIVRLYEDGDREAAEARNRVLREELADRNATLGSEELAARIEALDVEREQMAAAAASPDAAEIFAKRSKQRIYQGQTGRRDLELLREGDEGLPVETLQQALKDAGFYTGPVDGKFGDEVRRALEAYQAAQNLPVDGVAGPNTLDKLGLY